MKILFASAEVAPFSKAGGLADVVGSLPKYLEQDAEIAIFTPLHGLIDKEKYHIEELENSEMWLTFGNQGHKFKLYMCKLPDTNINVFFIQNDWYFSCFKEVYPKWLDTRYEHERYIAFSLAVLEYAKALNYSRKRTIQQQLPLWGWDHLPFCPQKTIRFLACCGERRHKF